MENVDWKSRGFTYEYFTIINMEQNFPHHISIVALHEE